jgi:outer membrane biosynthesis protein TonB
MPASSVLLASTFHASIIFALLWAPLTKIPALVPDDAVELTIERQTASSATMVQPVATPEPPVVSPPIQPPAPVPEQSAPQVEPAQAPTLEGAVPEPEPAPKLTLRDFPKTEPVVGKTEQKKPAPKADPKTDSNKALVPPAEGRPQTASPPTPLPNQADVAQPDKARNERLARLLGTRYFERMGIRPSHQATLTQASGRACPLDPEPYKLEIVNNKLTVTNDYGIMFSVTVPANGEIDQLYKRAPMAGDHASDAKGTWMKYRMMGNVKSGKLEIWYNNCVYTLIVY